MLVDIRSRKGFKKQFNSLWNIRDNRIVFIFNCQTWVFASKTLDLNEYQYRDIINSNKADTIAIIFLKRKKGIKIIMTKYEKWRELEIDSFEIKYKKIKIKSIDSYLPAGNDVYKTKLMKLMSEVIEFNFI